MSSLRVLCLHSHQSSADELRLLLEPRLGPQLWHQHGIDLVYVNAPHSLASEKQSSSPGRIWCSPGDKPSGDDAPSRENVLLQASLQWLHQVWRSPLAEDDGRPFSGLLVVGHEAAVVARAFVQSFLKEHDETEASEAKKEPSSENENDQEEEEDSTPIPSSPANCVVLPPAFVVIVDDDRCETEDAVPATKGATSDAQCEYLHVDRNIKAIETSSPENEENHTTRPASFSSSAVTRKQKDQQVLSTAQLNVVGRFLVAQKKKLCPCPQLSAVRLDKSTSTSEALAVRTAEVALWRNELAQLEQEASRYFCDAVRAQPPTALMAVIDQRQSLVAGWRDRSTTTAEEEDSKAADTTSTDLTTRSSVVEDKETNEEEPLYPHRPRPPGGGAPCPPVVTPTTVCNDTPTTVSNDKDISSLSASLQHKLQLEELQQQEESS